MNQTIENTELIQEQSEALQLFGMPIYIFCYAGVFLFLFTYLKMAKKNNKIRNEIALVGERYSGKTQLFISMTDGKKYETCPSIKNNSSKYAINKKNYKLTDYHGDGISKDQVITNMDSIFCLVHLIDGTDINSFTDAALFMYRVLINKAYQKGKCEYLVFLNKNDDKKYIGLNKAKQRIEDEIEHIKNSRINSGEQDKEGQQDYIKLSKGRFKVPFTFIEGSAQTNIKDLQMTLQNL